MFDSEFIERVEEIAEFPREIGDAIAIYRERIADYDEKRGAARE